MGLRIGERGSGCGSRFLSWCAVIGFACLLWAGAASADNYLTAIYGNGQVSGSQVVFPNWRMVWVGSFDVQLADNDLSPEYLTGLTVVNFGTATSADISGVYWRAVCPKADTGLMTMNYVGIYDAYDTAPSSHPAWTWWWGGAGVDLSKCDDEGLGGIFTVNIYVDISACPTPGATINLGFPVNAVNNPTLPGSITDDVASALPWANLPSSKLASVQYTYKVASRDSAPPGDTVTYTVYYGRPGTAAFTDIVVFDTLPAYTHYLPGSAVPAPDTGWAPAPGPPQRLLWTLPGGPVAQGQTTEVRFSVSIDWGNTEAFEPGSGDVAAPEGSKLSNRAQVFWNGMSGCSRNGEASSPAETVVRRFLFWKLGNNDVLFSGMPGQEADNITYSIYLKNMSATKTWWDVRVWDTVPELLDVWQSDCGLYDPFIGWTMTPTGGANANPGYVLAGGNTILTWRLDMPPKSTIEVRWRASLRPEAEDGQTILNTMSVMALGATGIFGGTGHSGRPASFSHLAPIVLPTTYISYVGYSYSTQSAPGFQLVFFPLHQRTSFELRGLEYLNTTAFAQQGGVSGSIGCLIGSCLGGFQGNSANCPVGPILGGGRAGCKAERAPAVYDPAYTDGTPDAPVSLMYKVVSNSPVLWQFLQYIGGSDQDHHTYAPATSLSYTGLMHYFWRRTDDTDEIGQGDSMGLINTGKDAFGAFDPNLPTTVHLFKFNYSTLTWDYRQTYEISGESVAYNLGTPVQDVGAWRSISSVSQLIVNQGMNLAETLDCCCECANDHGSYTPTRETGNVVSQVGVGTFYGFAQPATNTDNIAVIGNTGVQDATYRIYRYMPSSTVPQGLIPPGVSGTSGSWLYIATHVVPAGLNNPDNPRAYGPWSSAFSAGTLSVFKVELVSGGPIQFVGGSRVFRHSAGGAVMHAADGGQVGQEFWMHETGYTAGGVHSISIFCPKANMYINAKSEDGYDSTYKSSGPDQCVMFLELTNPDEKAVPSKRNYKFTVVDDPITYPDRSLGDVITICCMTWATEKSYTAPFLRTGTHYYLMTPPIVYVGQRFWMTVVVLDATGGTKEDYCGTAGFTSTDALAQIEMLPMGSYSYVWSNDTPGSLCDTGSDNGIKLFVNASLSTIGLHTIVASDMLDGSITGLGTISVVGVDVKLTKEPGLRISASGDTVQFKICWSNYSSGSAENFVITDRIPGGMTYLPDLGGNHLCGGTYDTSDIGVAYSITDNAPGSFSSADPAATTPAGVTWLRWTVPAAGIRTTGCVCFKARVN